jgi:hypothetical protein
MAVDVEEVGRADVVVRRRYGVDQLRSTVAVTLEPGNTGDELAVEAVDLPLTLLTIMAR